MSDDLMESEDGYTFYPTDAALELVTNFAGTPHQLFDLVKSVWYTTDFATVADRPVDDEYEVVLITTGWSGNESLIGALDRSWVVSSQFWYSSARGGKHVYRVRTELWDTPIVLSGTLDDIAGRTTREPAIVEVIRLLDGGDISDEVAARAVDLLKGVVVSDFTMEPLSAEDNSVVLRWVMDEMEAVVRVYTRRYMWKMTLPEGVTSGDGAAFPVNDFTQWLRVMQRVKWDRARSRNG